ncbi:MAG: hypothetical protein ACKV22_21710 [Bryobacteraceae bacterium]
MTKRRNLLAGMLGAAGLSQAGTAKEALSAGEAEARRGSGLPILFTHRDTVVDFNPVTGIGTHVGTVEGRIKGVALTNFQFIPTSQTEIRFDNRCLITDMEGDQLLFRVVGTGKFIVPPLGDSSPLGSLMGLGGPLTATYECTNASGKYAFLVGRKFGARELAANPARPLPGQVYVEVYADRFD